MELRFSNGSIIRSIDYKKDASCGEPRLYNTLMPGDKLWAKNVSHASEISQSLTEINIPNRIGYNEDSGDWSVVIL